jgi:hypothetical protein
LYEKSILQIPQEFSDLESYCNAFEVHILEETRSTLKKEIDDYDFSSTCAVAYTKQKFGSTITIQLSESIFSPRLGIFLCLPYSTQNPTSFLAKIIFRSSQMDSNLCGFVIIFMLARLLQKVLNNLSTRKAPHSNGACSCLRSH